jgi:ABC-type multidrug transport system fused ATPase/permease subunit
MNEWFIHGGDGMKATKSRVVTENAPSALHVMRRYMATNGRHTPVIVLTIVFSLLSSAALGVMTLTFQALIDSFGATGTILSRQTAFLLVSLAVFIPAQYLQQFLGLQYSELCDRTMRVKTFSLISRMDMQALDAQSAGDIVSRANSDLGQVNWSLQNFFSVRLPQQIIGVVALIISIRISWQLTLLSLAIAPVFIVLQVQISKPLTRFMQEKQTAAGQSLAIANNLMGGYEIAKAYNMGGSLMERYNATVEKATLLHIRANRATILLFPFSQILFFLPQILICGFGVYLASIHQISSGGIMAVIMLSIFIRNPIGDLSMVLTSFKTARSSATRVFELWDMPLESSGGTQTVGGGDVISFSEVRFSYPGKAPVLRNLSFEIHRGERVALVGASGGGKSTVIKLLIALYQKSAGEITVFGRPLEEWSTGALRAHISYVGQDAYLFTGSIWENIALGKENATDKEIEAVIEAALLGDVDVHREIGEGGLRLSGGQRQRVAIARAMLKNAPLLLLDEPTSALDTQSEAQVSVALQRLMEGKTTIIIAHRLSALRGVDRILCLKDGAIAESGTHEELMALRGTYYRLYQSQEKEETLHEAVH